MAHLTPFHLTQEEIHALACAVARSVDPDAVVETAQEASRVVWAHDTANPVLRSLATAFAEAAY